MRFNQKVILSLLTIGILACVASAGTWAYFQDTITSSENGISIGGIELWVNNVRGSADGTVTITGIILENIIPEPRASGSDGSTYIPNRKINTFTVENRGSLNGRLYLQVIPRSETLGKDSHERIIIMADVNDNPTTIYDNGDNKVSNPTYIATIGPQGSIPVNLYSNFPDNGQNQNDLEGKELKFDLVFILSTK
jgi:predicted ribosomally synthesized peptide with SipW-like signal peptide